MQADLKLPCQQQGSQAEETDWLPPSFTSSSPGDHKKSEHDRHAGTEATLEVHEQ